ncbi:MAG: hypothetical protein IJ800_06630 [Clostridia bacterium]|nr:hypothetical protein [Clostridia bacterium]
MKSKKLLTLISALTAAAFTVGSYTAVALADDGDENGTDEPSVSYGLRYVDGTTEKAAYANPFDYIIKYEDGKEVAFDAEIEDFGVYTVNDEEVPSTAYDFDSKDMTVEYFVTDDFSDQGVEYVVKATVDGEVYATNVKVSLHAPENSLYYDFDDEKLAAAKEAVKSVTDNLTGKTSVSFTSTDVTQALWDLVKSEVFARKDLKISLFVATPGSSLPTSATSTNTSGSYPSISLGASGQYKFWILYQDAERGDYNNAITTDGLKFRKNGKDYGWYEPDGKLVIPVFTFDFTADDAAVVTPSGGGEKGILNYKYSDISFAVENGTVESIELFYRASDDAEWSKATEDEATFDAESFTASSINFTPVKKGEFKVVCTAIGTKNDTRVQGSATVKVNREYEVAELVDLRVQQFFQNNWQSLIFLGIAVICLIGIIVIAFYKPKDAPAKKEKTVIEEKTTEAEEVKEADDATEETAEETTEEAVEATEETAEETTEEVVEAADGTTEEQPTEEVKPEESESVQPEATEEKPAEEVTAPVEEGEKTE